MIQLTPAALRKLEAFERHLDPADVTAGLYRPEVLGYGEITTVFAFPHDEDLSGKALKRMALFRTDAEAERLRVLFVNYHEHLNRMGVRTPDYGTAIVPGKRGEPVLYLLQEMVDPQYLCHRLIHRQSEAEAVLLFRHIAELIRVLFDQGDEHMEVAIDGQLSNFALLPPREEADTPPQLYYLDTSTPFIRRDGEEQLDVLLFLRVLPHAIRGVFKWLFVDEILDKYYSFRGVIVDLIANLHKEKQAALIPPFVAEANRFLAACRPGLKPISTKEVDAYYRQDAFTWELVYRLRNLEYWLQTRLLRQDYPHIRPGKVER